MDHIQFIILGLLQGVTEFLPISSSAHLILVPEIFGWHDQGLAIDLAAHVGTLTAVISYFRHELRTMLTGWVRSGFSFEDQQSLYVWYIAIGTLPVAVAGLFLNNLVEGALRSPLVIAVTTIAFGLLLGVADRTGRRNRAESDIRWRDVLLIGLAQVLALVPGTSRSGITMTAGLLLGLDRMAASRFSFMLSIPVTLLAGSYGAMKLVMTPQPVDWSAVAIVVLVSAGTAFLTIHYFLKFLQRFGMMPYVIYRLILGVVLVMIF